MGIPEQVSGPRIKMGGREAPCHISIFNETENRSDVAEEWFFPPGRPPFKAWYNNFGEKKMRNIFSKCLLLGYVVLPKFSLTVGNQPVWKTCASQLGYFPQGSWWKQKRWNHHQVLDVYIYIYKPMFIYYIYRPMISISHVYYCSLTLVEKIILRRSYSGCHSSSTHLCRVHKGSQAFQAILATIPQLFFQEKRNKIETKAKRPTWDFCSFSVVHWGRKVV